MTTTINASTSSGLINTADTSGILQLQTANTAALTIDASQNVGVGTASPSGASGKVLEIYGSAGQARLVLKNDATGSASTDGSQIALVGSQLVIQNRENSDITFETNGSERARIDSSGNVGIGTSSPAYKLDVAGASGVAVNIANTSDSSRGGRIVASGSSASGTFAVNTTSSGYALTFGIDNTEKMRLDSSGNLGLGVTPSAWRSGASAFQSGGYLAAWTQSNGSVNLSFAAYEGSTNVFNYSTTGDSPTMYSQLSGAHKWYTAASGTAGNAITFTQAMTLDASGSLIVGYTGLDIAQNVIYWNSASGTSGHLALGTKNADGSIAALYINRQSTDGPLVEFRQANTTEGSITVSGTTVSYNGGHLARFAQTTAPKDETLVKGTVLSNLDEMNVYVDSEGNNADNEQLNKVKVSDTEGDVNVAGVFVNWSHDSQHNVDEINMAMTGDMIIRIAQGTTVQRGDLLMSAGDGTAMPQGDDIVRSKTVAKVTSTSVTCTYADGSYCVPCVLMAC